MSDAEEITRLHEQLAAHRATLAVLLRQLASLGTDYAPPGVHNGITQARATIAQLKAQLRAAGITAEDQTGDIAAADEVIAPMSGHPSTVHGDYVGGDKVIGDKVLGDKYETHHYYSQPHPPIDLLLEPAKWPAPQRWPFHLVVGLTISLVLLVGSVLAFYLGTIGSHPTPLTPTLVTQAPISTLSVQPTEIPPMSADLNIAVARFGRLASNGKAIDSVDAGDISEKVYSSLKAELELLRQEHSQTRYTIQIQGPSEIGAIKGTDREEQAQEAEKLADAHNAHIVVYGNLDADGTSFHLELYLAANRLKDAEEFVKEPEESVGQYDFGSTVEVADDITTNPIARQHLRDSVLKQVSGIAQFMLGLGHYHLDEFEQAEEFFQSAANNVVITGSGNEQDEKAVYYLFLGNTALKANNLVDAEKYYNQALAYSPGYARALLGAGAVLYEKSRAQCKEGKADGESIQKAIDDYYKPALVALNKPIRSNITVKTAYYLGFAYLCLSQAQITNKWDDAKVQLQVVVAEYEGGNDQMRERAAEAYAGLGFIALPFINDPDAEAKFQSAAKMYGMAVDATHRPILQAQYYTWLAYIHLRLTEHANYSKECTDASKALAKADAAFARIAQPNLSDQAFRQDVGRRFANTSCARDSPRN